MKLIFDDEWNALKREIDNLKNEVQAYKRMSAQNHHVCLNLCEKATAVLNLASALRPGCPEAMHALSKAVLDAEGVPFKEQKRYDFEKLADRLKEAYKKEDDECP